MRLLLVTRLSQERGDGKKTGYESQTEAVLRWAEYEGHTIVHVAADRKSGTVQPWDRPNLKPWVTDPRKIALYEGVVAYKIDRLSRGDDESTTRIEDWAREHNKRILTVAERLEYPCEGTDGIRWDIGKRIAHQEWLDIRERYGRMQRHIRNLPRPDGVEGGHLIGRAPYGYRIVELDTGHKILEPDPVKANAVKEMAARYLNDEPVQQICFWLEETGIPSPTGRQWWPKSVRTILSNPAVLGRRSDGHRMEPILDRETYSRIKAKIEAGKVTKPRGPRIDPTTLLGGIIYCATCGRLMTIQKQDRKHADGSIVHHAYYRCAGSEREPSKCKNMPKMADVDTQFETYLLDLLGSVDLIELSVTPVDTHELEIGEVEDRIAALRPRTPGYREEHARLMAELDRLTALPVAEAEVKERPTGVTIGRKWESLATSEARNKWLKEGLVKVYVYRDEVFHVELSAVLGQADGAGWRVAGPSVLEVIQRTS